MNFTMNHGGRHAEFSARVKNVLNQNALTKEDTASVSPSPRFAESAEQNGEGRGEVPRFTIQSPMT